MVRRCVAYEVDANHVAGVQNPVIGATGLAVTFYVRDDVPEPRIHLSQYDVTKGAPGDPLPGGTISVKPFTVQVVNGKNSRTYGRTLTYHQSTAGRTLQLPTGSYEIGWEPPQGFMKVNPLVPRDVVIPIRGSVSARFDARSAMLHTEEDSSTAPPTGGASEPIGGGMFEPTDEASTPVDHTSPAEPASPDQPTHAVEAVPAEPSTPDQPAPAAPTPEPATPVPTEPAPAPQAPVPAPTTAEPVPVEPTPEPTVPAPVADEPVSEPEEPEAVEATANTPVADTPADEVQPEQEPIKTVPTAEEQEPVGEADFPVRFDYPEGECVFRADPACTKLTLDLPASDG